MSLISSLLFLIDFGGYESFVKFYFIKLRMRNFYLPKTISSILGLALKTPKTITLGDICKSTRTSRKKSFILRLMTDFILKATLGLCQMLVFLCICK